VQCVVTSPPYFGLRDYGTPGQLGLEGTPQGYVMNVVDVFRGIRRVLKNDGTVWRNLGDSYANDTKWGGQTSGKHARSLHGKTPLVRARRSLGLKSKDLIGVPWLVALALQADGWYLRSDIIWSKPNPMPESVTDRPTKAHEYLFLLTKSERYYYDAEAIREANTAGTIERLASGPVQAKRDQPKNVVRMDGGGEYAEACGRNKRSVWTIPTMPYAGAHFATMPEKLVEPCILAGSRLGDLVLDPFLGSGTVGAVSERLGRRWVGTDLSYQGLAKARTAQRGLRFVANE